MAVDHKVDTLGDQDGPQLTLGVAARLSRYLQVLTQARKMGKTSISSQAISEYTNINPTQIRRDLSTFGKFGKRGVGYDIEMLLEEIRGILGTRAQYKLALFGAGNLGQAIATSSIFADHGFQISAIFDIDSEKVGTRLGGNVVLHYNDLSDFVESDPVMVGVLAIPAESAQVVADDLVSLDVKIIFNYSDALLNVPSDVTVHTSSPAVELLYALYFYLT